MTTVEPGLLSTPKDQQGTLQKMMPRHFKILELKLEGFPNKAIAQALNMTKEAISMISRGPLFQNELARRRKERNRRMDQDSVNTVSSAKALLEESAYDAAEVQVSHLGNLDPMVQHRASESILTRVFGTSKSTDTKTVIVIEKGAVQLVNMSLSESEEARKVMELKDGKVIVLDKQRLEKMRGPTTSETADTRADL